VTSAADKPHLLFVDDCADLAELIKFVLESNGWIVDIASDGLHAIEQLAKQSYQLILLDLQMPNMDGLSFLKWKKSQADMDIPVVVYTSHDDPETCAKLDQAGASKVLHKPLRANVLSDELSCFLHSSSAASRDALRVRFRDSC